MNSRCTVAGIILAAGEGTRMGGDVKQLLPFRGGTLLECVVDSALASGLDPVIVVLGHRSGDTAAVLEGRNVTVVINRDYPAGQGSSIKAGLAALSDDAGAALFLLGDQPLITPALIDDIISAFRTSRSPVIIPTYAGRRGNPVLFGRETFPYIRTLDDSAGARELFPHYADRLQFLPVDDAAVLRDIDTPEEYRQLLAEA